MANKIRAYLNIIAFAAVILVNFLAESLPLNGNTTGELSDKYNVLITPSGYVFSIWGLIYLLLGLWVIYQALPKQMNKAVFRRIGYWFVLSCIFNCLWIFVWHYEKLELSLLVMIGLLASLIIIYYKINNNGEYRSFIRIPFSIYLGWVSVATIVNASVVLKYNGWEGFGLSDVTWTIIMLLIGTLLAMYFSLKNNDILYPLVFVWAYFGIGIRHIGTLDILSNISFSLAALLLIFIIWRSSKRTNSVHHLKMS
jgi:hypothetical protein